MKKLLSILLTTFLLFSFVGTIFSANMSTSAEVDVSSLNFIYNNNHDNANLVNPIANVQRVSSVTSANLKNLSVAYIDLNSVSDATAALNACISAKVVPTFYITTNAMADKVVSAISSAGKYDVNVISNSTGVLAYLRGKNNKVRTGLSLSIATEMSDGTLSVAEANTIRKKVRSAPATFIVIDSKYATKQSVNALQEFALAVWVNVSSAAGTDAFRVEAIKALTTGAHGVISASASAISDIIRNDFVPNSFTRVSYTIGHAGNYDVAEENTMASFIAAYENGATFLELDTGITSDGVVVLLHDNTLNRTTNYTGSKNIWEMTWAEVQQYNVIDTKTKVDTGKPIPTFEELLIWAKDKDVKFFVEFKSTAHNVIGASMELIKKHDMIDQCDFLSFYGNCIGTVLTSENGVSTSRLFFNEDTQTTNQTYADSLATLDYWITNAQASKSTISPPRYDKITNTLKNVITHDLMQAATDRGMTVWPWTYDTNSANDAFFACVDGMTMVNAQDYKDMVKLAYSSGVSMYVGQTYNGGSITAETYSGSTFSVNGANTVATVVSGDCVTVKNGKLVAVKEGTASVIFGCKSNTYKGNEYVVYTEPVTVTVNNGNASVLAPLVTLAETATVNSLSEKDLGELRSLYATAKNLIQTNSTDSTAITATANALSALLDKFIVTKYVAPAPNYSNTQFDDDGSRLMDGIKGTTNGNTTAYCAWSKGTTGIAEIVLQYSSPLTRDTFSAYFAADEWGVKNPTELTIYYSDNGTDWTEIKKSATKDLYSDSTTSSDGIWDLWKYTVVADTPVTASQFKFKITINGGFVWIDEIEASNSTDNTIYVSGINKKIAAGVCSIFTPSISPLSISNTNARYSYNILAKYDSALGAYKVTKKNVNIENGLTLASDEILIAAHDWETGVTDDSIVVGSAKNRQLVLNAQVGQIIEFYGIDTANWTTNVAPAIKIVDKHTHSFDSDWKSDKNGHWKECDCGEAGEATAHDDGEWITDEDGKSETLYCTECGYELNSREIITIGKLGDVDGNDLIDSVDYLLIKRFCFNSLELTEEQKARADIDKDGYIEAVDYLLVKRCCFNSYEIN